MSLSNNPLLLKITSYLELFRVSNLPTVWMNAVAACLLSGGELCSLEMPLLLIALSMVYCGGMAMNDCLDAAADAVTRPDRPIPSGRITSWQGHRAYLALFIGAVFIFQAAGGHATALAGLVLLALVLLYNLTHTLSSLAIIPLGGCRFLIYMVIGAAFSTALPMTLIALAGLQFGYVLLLSLLARREKEAELAGARLPAFSAASSGQPSLVPAMLAGIPLIDGLVLALMLGPLWLLAGIAGVAATAGWQRKIRGD